MVARLGTCEISRVHRLVLYCELGSSLTPALLSTRVARLAHWLKETKASGSFFYFNAGLVTDTDICIAQDTCVAQMILYPRSRVGDAMANTL